MSPPPWEDCLPLPPQPAEGEYLLVPPPPPWKELSRPCLAQPENACLAPPKDACLAPPKDACLTLPKYAYHASPGAAPYRLGLPVAPHCLWSHQSQCTREKWSSRCCLHGQGLPSRVHLQRVRCCCCRLPRVRCCCHRLPRVRCCILTKRMQTLAEG
ncbi:UNVERIFIED_CONTAM: hypothetical protein FKN15_041441 [Acipenser sinensis]